MKASGLLLLAVLAACSSDRVETFSRAPAFRATVLAVAGVRGARGKGGEIVQGLASMLGSSGMRCVDLQESDSVLAGSVLSLDAVSNPRLMAEVRRATEADGLAFISMDTSWRFLEIVVLDVRNGEPVLKAEGRPRGEAFATPQEASAVAAEILGVLSQHARRAALATDSLDEIPVP
ncbi:MAG: hypothetical protein A2506_06500 [Elusimicrobia bacterium RIFOXYD12_FULL_66_9]|nr:MAG: hypothetical protein A2506_06500 [Elusimicrobia bacterium RIFOXYD12_FULL_66_9]